MYIPLDSLIPWLIVLGLLGLVAWRLYWYDEDRKAINMANKSDELLEYKKQHPNYSDMKAQRKFMRKYGKEINQIIRDKEEKDRKEFEEWKKEKRPWER